jgi:hypothetical protein
MLIYYKNAPVEYDMDKVNIGTGIWAGCFFAASGVAALLFTMGYDLSRNSMSYVE